MWNFSAPNRILQRRMKQYHYLRHRAALKNVRPQINNGQPAQFVFLKDKKKTKQIQNERQEVICQQNSHLVNKMMTSRSSCNPRVLSAKRSLNEHAMRKRSYHIDQQNEKILFRLRSARSEYSKQQLSKSQEGYFRLKQHLQSSRMDPYYDLLNSRSHSRPTSAKK